MSTTITRPAHKPSPLHAQERGEFINRYVNTIYGFDGDAPAIETVDDFWRPAWNYAYALPDMRNTYWTEGMIDLDYGKLEPYLAMSTEELDAVIAVCAVPGTKATEPLIHMVCARACKEVP